MKISKIMTRAVRTCRADDDMRAAAEIMWDKDCGCVPVVDDGGRAIAMITDRDLCMAAYTQDARLRDMRVGSAMSSELFTCAPDDDLTDAERTMRLHQVRRLPVVDANQMLLGIVSLADIVNATAHKPVARAKDAVLGATIETLAAITEPRPHNGSGHPQPQ